MYKTILHATDLSENHYQFCQQTVRLAHSLQAKIYFLHVIELPKSLILAQSLGFAEMAKPAKEDAQTVMQLLGEDFNIPQHHLFVEVGSPSQHILAKIKTLDCDLVIIGEHAPSHIPAFLGSTAHAVIHHASCDVLTLRTEKVT